MEKIEDKTMRKCSRCDGISKYKYMKRINGEILCAKCYQKNRKERRKETIDQAGIKEEVIKLDRQRRNEYNKKWRENQKNNKNYEPKIKGDKKDTKKKKSNAYLTLEERQALLRILMSKGLEFTEAKERISDIVKQQAIVRKKLKQEKKTEEEIKQKQKQLLEELWLN